MVSLTNDGNEPKSTSFEVAISSQVRYDAFISQGTNLVPGVAMPAQAYIRDTCQSVDGPILGCTPSTILVSADSSGNAANNGVQGVAVSGNGRFVSFSSRATNLPGALSTGANEVYVRDTCLTVANCTPSTTMVSVDNAGNPGPTGVAGPTSISDDGRVIGMISLDPLAPNNSIDWNLYLRDTCQTESGTVSNCTPATITASVATGGGPANAGLVANAFNPHLVSGTGRFAVFNSTATNLVSGGTPPTGVFVRDTCIGATGCTPSTVLASVDSSGNFVLADYGVISADGHYCAFVGQVGGGGSAQSLLAGTSF